MKNRGHFLRKRESKREIGGGKRKKEKEHNIEKGTKKEKREREREREQQAPEKSCSDVVTPSLHL